MHHKGVSHIMSNRVTLLVDLLLYISIMCYKADFLHESMFGMGMNACFKIPQQVFLEERSRDRDILHTLEPSKLTVVGRD